MLCPLMSAGPVGRVFNAASSDSTYNYEKALRLQSETHASHLGRK